jgi:hemoglobin-like flavoprotein
MTPKQICLVRESFEATAPRREQLAAGFFADLFSRDPSLRRLFDDDPAARGAELYYGLSAIVGSLGRLHAFQPALEWLALRYGRRGLGAPQYAAIGEALLATLERGLGEAFTADHRAAWEAARDRIVGLMIRALEEEPLAA